MKKGGAVMRGKWKKRCAAAGVALTVFLGAYEGAADAAPKGYEADARALQEDGMHMGQRPSAAEHYRDGEALRERKQYAQAIEAYGKALTADSSYKEALFGRAEARMELKEYAGAEADYSQAISLDTGMAAAFFKRGVCRYYLGQYEAAAADEAVLLRLQPQHAGAYLVQAVCYEKLGRGADALSAYEALLAQVPKQQKEPRRIAETRIAALRGTADAP